MPNNQNQLCECQWENCDHKGRAVPAVDWQDDIRTSPELCMACLFGCTDEEDEEMDEGNLDGSDAATI